MVKRFELKANFLNGHCSIVDWVESEQKDAICIFNDLGVLPFSSAPSVCNLLNQFNNENEWLKKENEQLKQFKEDVFDLINKEIIQNEEAIEWGNEWGVDVGAIEFYTNMLKILRKELQK